MVTILVTGDACFIGAKVVRYVHHTTDFSVVNLDLLTYAGNRESLDGLPADRHHFVQGDILDDALLKTLFEQHRPSAVVHFAAESHVDRSIDEIGRAHV